MTAKFLQLTQTRIRHGVLRSVQELVAAIEDCMTHDDDDARPFAWTDRRRDPPESGEVYSHSGRTTDCECLGAGTRGQSATAASRCGERGWYRDMRRARPVRHVPLWGIALELRYAPRLATNGRTSAIAARIRPKVQTVVAPVGRSKMTEKYIPSIETTAPMTHPMARRGPIRFAQSMAPTDGTIR